MDLIDVTTYLTPDLSLLDWRPFTALCPLIRMLTLHIQRSGLGFMMRVNVEGGFFLKAV